MKKTLLLSLVAVLATITHAQQSKPQMGDPNADLVISEPAKNSPQNFADTNKVFTAVETNPEFPEGWEKFPDYIKANLRYPVAARNDGVQGKVFLTFIVERDGSLTNIKVVRGIGSGCDEEAVRLLKACPKWHPGIRNGHTVRVAYATPISFYLGPDN
ncbi:MAG TPA: energy transducer TonB [Mucilaginibacter sp.]|nr:energy transducer TonB [Mucilaginibacter sp.]